MTGMRIQLSVCGGAGRVAGPAGVSRPACFKPLLMVLLGSASMACAFAALGVALYANGPSAAAALLFGSIGGLAGLLCALLQWVVDGLPVPQRAALPAEALARLMRATLASAASERPARPGSAADRRPAPADARRVANSAFGA